MHCTPAREKKKKKKKKKIYHVKEEKYAEGVHQGLGEIEECSKGGKVVGMKGASQVRKSKAKGKGKVKGESEKQYQEKTPPVNEEFIPNGLKGETVTVDEDMETYYLTIHNDMLSYNSSNDEVTVKYYVTHMYNREFNLEEGNQDMPRNIYPTLFYYVQRKKQLEKMLKEHSALYKHIFKMWEEDIEIGEKEKERKNIFAWGILPVRAYDHPNIFVPLPYGFKHNNKNLAYSSRKLKRSFAHEEEEEDDDHNDVNDGYGGDENGNVMEKRGKEEKKKDYMNIKYANLTGPCITWRKNCISFNYLKKRKNSHLVQAFPYLFCMQGPKIPLFSLERNVLYCNENNRSIVVDDPVTCRDARSNPFTCRDVQNEKNFIWDKQEIKTFLEKYFLYPKNFEKISQYLEFKSTKQCVDFYYLTKNFFNFKNYLRTISLSRVKRNKRHRSVGNDTTKKNSKEEIVAQLMEKLERNCDPSEFEQSNFFHLNFINLRHFFQNYFAKTFSHVQSSTGGGGVSAAGGGGGGSGDPLRTSTSLPLGRSVTSAQNIDGGTTGPVTQRSKTIVLENMSDGYVVPKNYKFILSTNKKLCFLVKNEENLIYSGINSDIIEIVYNDNMDGDRKKRKNERSENCERGENCDRGENCEKGENCERSEKKKKVEKVEKVESIEKMDKQGKVPFLSQNPAQLTLDKVALVDNQQPSTATCSSMITTPPPSNSNEVSEKAIGDEGFSNLGNDPPPKGFNASATGEFFPPMDEEKTAHWEILHANAIGKLKKEKRDNHEIYGQLSNFNNEEKTHNSRESDEKKLQNGEPTRVPAIWISVKDRRDKMDLAYNCSMNSNRDDYNPFGENGQVVNLRRRSSASSSKRGEEEEGDDGKEEDDEEEEEKKKKYDEEVGSLLEPSEVGSLVQLSEVGSHAQLSEVKAHDIYNVDSRRSSGLGLYPQQSNDGDAVGRVSYPDSNESINNPFENSVKIETSEESLYKCYEFLKNINFKDTKNVATVSSKNGVQQEPMDIGRYSGAPVSLECKMKKVSRKNSIQSNEGVCLQKEKIVKRKEIIPAGKSKGVGGGKDNTLVGEIGQWEEGTVSALAGVGPCAVEEGSTGHLIRGRNKDERNHSGKKGKTAVNHTWVNATTKRRFSIVSSLNGIGEGAVGAVGTVGSGARDANLKKDFTIKPEYEKALKRKKTSNAQMSEEGSVVQARWDKWAINRSEEVLSDDRTNSMIGSQLRSEAMRQVCDLNMSEGLMSQACASQEYQSHDILINRQSLDTQNSWVHDSNESGGLLIGRSHLSDREDIKQDRLCSGDNFNLMSFNKGRSAIPLQGEERWDDMKWNGGSSSVASCKKRKVSDNTGGGNDEEEEAVAAELAGKHPLEKQPVESHFTQLQIRENRPERSDMEHRRNSVQSSKSSNQCSMDSLQHMESYDGGSCDDPSRQPFRKTATKWTDREKEIYFEVFEKEGKNWDTLLLALHPYGKTKEQIKNFYQNTIVKRRKSEAP